MLAVVLEGRKLVLAFNFIILLDKNLSSLIVLLLGHGVLKVSKRIASVALLFSKQLLELLLFFPIHARIRALILSFDLRHPLLVVA